MNLYELTKEAEALEALIIDSADENGEIIGTEQLDAWGDEIGLALDAKLDGIARLCRNWSAEAGAIKAEEARLNAKRKALENREKALKAYAFRCLELAGLDKLKTCLFTVAIQANGGVAPIEVDQFDPAEWPARFQIVEARPKMDEIRIALESGEKLEFARIGERGRSLRIR